MPQDEVRDPEDSTDRDTGRGLSHEGNLERRSLVRPGPRVTTVKSGRRLTSESKRVWDSRQGPNRGDGEGSCRKGVPVLEERDPTRGPDPRSRPSLSETTRTSVKTGWNHPTTVNPSRLRDDKRTTILVSPGGPRYSLYHSRVPKRTHDSSGELCRNRPSLKYSSLGTLSTVGYTP